MKQKFTETDVETYYDTVETKYQIPWNPDGSKHWGYFEDLNAPNDEQVLIAACDRLNQYMLSQSNIDADARTLDVGCGNGNTAIYIAQETNCAVVGVDISNNHIQSAQTKAQDFPNLRLDFNQGSATNLPFEDESFSHVWSQGTLLHISQREVALQEIYRVLKPGGIFVFGDLVVKVPQISEETSQYVYQRLHVTELFSPQLYQTALSQIGFEIFQTQDLSWHMKKTYDIQIKRVKDSDPQRSLAYQKTSDAVVAGEIGWWLYGCKKL
ncbi:MAG: methyltransferase domain-containing protein [Symploca sp. SIO2E9]|nr:methyltransferase domain-containing protein [Symploca sp. SIO2E9]